MPNFDLDTPIAKPSLESASTHESNVSSPATPTGKSSLIDPVLMVLACALSSDPEHRHRQMHLLPGQRAQHIQALLLNSAMPNDRLKCLLTLAPQLRRLPTSQKKALAETLMDLVFLDQQINPLELTIYQIAMQLIEEHTTRRPPTAQQIKQAQQMLLTYLAERPPCASDAAKAIHILRHADLDTRESIAQQCYTLVLKGHQDRLDCENIAHALGVGLGIPTPLPAC